MDLMKRLDGDLIKKILILCSSLDILQEGGGGGGYKDDKKLFLLLLGHFLRKMEEHTFRNFCL